MLTRLPRHLDGTLKVKMYYGQKRETTAMILADADIILTTYHTLAADFAAKKGPIHEIAWYRIVLDEGRQNMSLYL
jgi:SWI/SNF-related matrix-associated actin-dependent regulator of chromatin subfamily A3